MMTKHKKSDDIILTCINSNCGKKFITTIERSKSDGFNGECPDCYSITQKITYLKRKKTRQAIYENEEGKTKVCNCCNKNLPINQFHRDARAKGGYKHICKDCTKKKRLNKSIEPLNVKKCRICNKTLPLDQFYKSATKKGGYTHECKSCTKKIRNNTYINSLSNKKKQHYLTKKRNQKSFILNILKKIIKLYEK